MRFVVLAALVLLALVPAIGDARAADPRYPALVGRVVDEAGVIPVRVRDGLVEALAQHERDTGQQVVVVTLSSLQGIRIEDFGVGLGRFWKIGDKATNTGALLIVAPADRRVRIEAGYGVEDRLTDATSRVIIERDILPAFRAGDLPAGIVAGTKSLLAVLRDGAPVRPPDTSQRIESILPFIFIGIFILLVVLQASGRGRGRFGPSAAPMIWTSGGRSSGGFSSGGFSGGGFSGGGSSGGGGFSGGGGSFGGGGATGQW